jgi:AraC family transcriptional regulator, transcriptional activator of pobA
LKAAQLQTAAFLALLETYHTTSKSPQHYAKMLGMTPTHLSRGTNQAVGHSASFLLSARKMHAAKTLLADTRIKVAQISRDLGFSSAGYFTRSFQSHCHLSPTQYRTASRGLVP